MRQNRQAFTLIEVAIAVFILLIILMLGVPSMSGVLADKRLRRSFDELNQLVREAQNRSVAERRPYLIVWNESQLLLRPEAFARDEKEEPVMALRLHRGDAYQLELPAALREEPPAEWIFWPSGTCEPATVKFKGVDGAWTANYSSLTARPELAFYAAR
ncbi:MAG TPA: prepilin-type N-terminal cleavage/methylation domain-containing protein [Chthoniobacterales bacterium]